MKFNWNPALFSEAVRQVVLALVLFGIINWSETQIAGAMMALSAVLAFFTFSTTTPNSTIEAAGTSKTQLNEAAKANTDAGTPGGTGHPDTPGGAGGSSAPKGLGNFSDKSARGLMFLIAVLGGSLLVTGCAKADPNLSPERRVALYGTQVAGYLKEVKTLADGLYADQTLPKAAYDRTLVTLKTVNEAGVQLATALQVYDAATNNDERGKAAAQVDAALATLNTLLPSILPEITSTEGRAKVGKVIADVQRLVLTILRFTAPSTVQERMPAFTVDTAAAA